MDGSLNDKAQSMISDKELLSQLQSVENYPVRKEQW
jgi:hypothetical protein